LTTSFDQIVAKNSSPLFFSASLYFCTALISLPIVVIFSPNWLSKLKANFAKLTLLGSLKALDMWFHVMAITSTVAANSVAVKQSGLLMSVGYGYFLFHEPNAKQRVLGCIVILAGVSLLSIL
jgi:drug/metabolite transporter (DMT)-like permease